MKIKVATSDCKIWNKQQLIFQIISAAQNGPLVLDLLYEGPDCNQVGIDSILDDVCNLLQVDSSHFLIQTSNQISSSRYTEQRTPFVELEFYKNLAKNLKAQPAKPCYKFGLFIGRSNWQRLGLAAHLMQHYRDQTLIRFHYDNKDDFHQSNFGLEQLIQKNWDKRHEVMAVLDLLPMVQEKENYPILWNTRAFDLHKQYLQILVDIVCETYFTGRTFFITEKTLRNFVFKRPFIIQGPKHFLTNLKKLGFQTFDTWWDEGYDQDADDARLQSICNNIDWIGQQTDSTLIQWHNEMQPVLEHNFDTFLNLTNKQILTTTFCYD